MSDGLSLMNLSEDTVDTDSVFVTEPVPQTRSSNSVIQCFIYQFTFLLIP